MHYQKERQPESSNESYWLFYFIKKKKKPFDNYSLVEILTFIPENPNNLCKFMIA